MFTKINQTFGRVIFVNKFDLEFQYSISHCEADSIRGPLSVKLQIYLSALTWWNSMPAIRPSSTMVCCNWSPLLTPIAFTRFNRLDTSSTIRLKIVLFGENANWCSLIGGYNLDLSLRWCVDWKKQNVDNKSTWIIQ